MSHAIKTFALTKRFAAPEGWQRLVSPRRQACLAVDRADLAVEEGEVFGLLGPNGAGKTTLIKMLCTLILPTSGTARVNGYDLRRDAAIRRCIGLASGDERSFEWRLTGRQNLEFFAGLHNLPPNQVPGQIDQVLDQVALREMADRPFRTYSSGMRQRLSIARALLNEPRILFLDEPTKSLDPTATQRLHELIRTHLANKRGITVVLATHRLAEAGRLCDRVAIMDRGRIRACGSVPDLRAELGLFQRHHLRVRGLPSGTQETLESRFSGLTITNSSDQDVTLAFDADGGDAGLGDVIDLLRRSGGEIRALSSQPVSLDSIFAQLTEGPDEPVPLDGQRSATETKETAPLRRSGAGDRPTSRSRRSSRSDGGRGSQLWTSLRTGWRIALAFLKRDLRSEVSYRLSFLLQFFSIFFSSMVFYFVAQLLGQAAAPYLEPYGGDYFSFVLIGIAFSGYLSVGLSSFSGSLRTAQTTGTLEAMLTSPASVSTIIVCSSLWSYLMTTFRVLVYLGMGAAFLGMNLKGGNYPVALLVLVLTVTSLSSLGILAASFIMVLKRGDPVTWLFRSLSRLLGGVYYPITVLPTPLQFLAYLLPITHSLHAMRLALLRGAPLSALAPQLLALTLFSLLFLPLSLVTFRYAVRRARVDGSLTHY